MGRNKSQSVRIVGESIQLLSTLLSSVSVCLRRVFAAIPIESVVPAYFTDGVLSDEPILLTVISGIPASVPFIYPVRQFWSQIHTRKSLMESRFTECVLSHVTCLQSFNGLWSRLPGLLPIFTPILTILPTIFTILAPIQSKFTEILSDQSCLQSFLSSI
jgi:hypothetical protein